MSRKLGNHRVTPHVDTGCYDNDTKQSTSARNHGCPLEAGRSNQRDWTQGTCPGSRSTPSSASPSPRPRRISQPTRLRPILAALLVVSSALGASCAAESSRTTVVASVVDGDTLVIDFSTGQSETVRLLGLDTPETVDPSRPEQCFGAEASAFAAELLPPGTPVRLERDVEARDRYGRLLAYVFRADDDLFVNAELLRHGFADLAIYEPNNGYATEFEADLLQAKTRLAGLWGTCGSADLAIDAPPPSASTAR